MISAFNDVKPAFTEQGHASFAPSWTARTRALDKLEMTLGRVGVIGTRRHRSATLDDMVRGIATRQFDK